MKAIVVSDKTWDNICDIVNAHLLRCALDGSRPLPGKSLRDMVKDLSDVQVQSMGADDDRPRLFGELVPGPEGNPYLARKRS
jgi:hypothetical protein